MLVALTLAFPSCNVEMELGNNTLEYRNIVNAQRISAATTGRTTGTTTTAYITFRCCASIPTEPVKTLSAFRMPADVGRNIPTPLRGTGTTLSTPASG